MFMLRKDSKKSKILIMDLWYTLPPNTRLTRTRHIGANIIPSSSRGRG